MVEVTTSRFFSVLGTMLGTIALVVALFVAPWGVLALSGPALLTAAVGVLRREGAGALLGAALGGLALLGPGVAAATLLLGAVIIAVAIGRPRWRRRIT